MNLLITIPCLLKGGTEMQSLQLVKVLTNLGHQTNIICYFEYDISIVEEFKKNNCEVLLLKLNRTISSLELIKKLKPLFKEIKPDLVHVQYMAPGMLPIIAARIAGIRNVITTVHQPYTKSHGIKAKLFLRISSILCKHVILVSKNAEISWFGSGIQISEIPQNQKLPKHFTIYNSIDVKQLESIQNNVDVLKERRKLKINDESIVFGMVSRLSNEKGIDIAIKAFKKVIDAKYNSILLIIGGGNEEDKLKKLCKDLQISEYVIFYGETYWQKAMKLMAIMDVLIVSSRFEGFGLSAAESMALKKPVIASNLFGLKELVSHNQSGFLFELENIDELYFFMSKFILNRDLIEQYGNKGNERVVKLFSLELYTSNIKKLCKAFLK
jgi:glycosyltransferase involved in cell wall biosynthesis